ncbi:hypothetical protein KKC_13935, partial [Listeria fleischmannii subsp. coloradonensis]
KGPKKKKKLYWLKKEFDEQSQKRGKVIAALFTKPMIQLANEKQIKES